ncbi:DUF3363 domain-containing protein [Roseibacterium beibuensis]|uniref:DUF3363 domain-containing protein n=1 Tax=[Roseibacterium] beibuensis TaxID=1193142 RepID=UPI00217E48CF|nr:DUF3363 domain-containing protein [Roseibacterium beibuensis]MCS6625434.1 DUF3363 domain-containing protein [Roseibacterium beibuensis]
MAPGGLARYRLDDDLETRLRGLQTRRDVTRTLNQRRMEGGRDVRVMDVERVRGVVVKAGAHDRDGAAAWAIVRDGGGREHYVRVRPGQRLPDVGRSTELVKGLDGLAAVARPRRLEL